MAIAGALKRVILETIGWLMVLAGIAALVLPGPGLLLLFGGMVLLSQQYEWAERRLRPVEVAALRTAAESVSSRTRIAMSVAGGLAIVAVGVVWTLGPEAPGWWPFRESWWLPGGWATGSTLIVSGLIALGIIGYSYKRFRGVEDVESVVQEIAAHDDSC